MEQTKSPFGSLTVLASVVAFIAAAFGQTITPEVATEALGHIDRIIAAVAALVAIYGRFRATKAISL